MVNLRSVWHALVLLILSVALLTYRKVIESRSNIHWVVMTKETSPALSKLIDMSHKFEEEITVIESESSLAECSKFLQESNLANNDIVIFTDSDTIVQVQSQELIRKRFLTFSKPIVIGGQETPVDKRCLNVPGPISRLQPFPYINSNMFMGRVWALRQFFIGIPLSDNESADFTMTKLHFRHKSIAEIDAKGHLFVTHMKKSRLSALQWNTGNQTATCHGTGTNPLIIQCEEPIPFYAFFKV
jgi:hypothetical protein